MMTEESSIKKAILDYLSYLEAQRHRIYFAPSGAGSIKTDTGRYFKTGRKGWPDITVLLNGIFIAIEVKSSTGRQSPAQKEAQLQIERCGGYYFVVRSISDVQDAIWSDKFWPKK